MVVYTEALRSSDSQIAQFLCRWQLLIGSLPGFLTFLLNIFLLLFYNPTIPDDTGDVPGGHDALITNRFDDGKWGNLFYSNYDWLGTIQFVLAILHVLASCLWLITVIVCEAPVEAYSSSRVAKSAHAEQELQKYLRHEDSSADEAEDNGQSQRSLVQLLAWPYECFLSLVLLVLKRTPGLDVTFTSLQQSGWLCDDDLDHLSESMYVGFIVLYVMLSFLGLLFNPLLFSLHTLVTLRTRVLSLVLNSLTAHYDKLLITFSFMVTALQ